MSWMGFSVTVRAMSRSCFPMAPRPFSRACQLSIAQPVEDEAVEKLRIEVRALLGEHLPAPHHGLELREGGGGDQKCGLMPAFTGDPDGLELVGRVVDV